jgi:threonine-phosphate decarboxylase
VYAQRNNQYVLPINHVCRLIEGRQSRSSSIDGVLLCNPNSPTGQACSTDDIARVARAAHRQGIWLVIDEAFVDYCPERSVLPCAASWPHVVVLRSMTKFYGLPGLRVGYAVATSSAIRRLQRQLPPWSVNVMGQVAARAALHDIAHARRSVQFMARERERFGKLLTALPGCSVIPTQANYFFMELPRGQHAHQLMKQLFGEGLLVRDCSSVPGANARFIRFAVRSRLENDRLVKALTRLLHRKTA